MCDDRCHVKVSRVIATIIVCVRGWETHKDWMTLTYRKDAMRWSLRISLSQFYDSPDLKCETFWSLRCLIYCFVGPQVEMYLAPTSARTKNGKNCKLMLRENPCNKFGRGCSPITSNVVGHSPCWQWRKPWLIYEWQYNLTRAGSGGDDHFIALLHLQSEAATKTLFVNLVSKHEVTQVHRLFDYPWVAWTHTLGERWPGGGVTQPRNRALPKPISCE